MKDYKIFLQGIITIKDGIRTIKANSIHDAGNKAQKFWNNCIILKVEEIIK